MNQQQRQAYKRLKAVYESEFGSPISDRTWRRRVSEMRQYLKGFTPFNKDASQAVRHYASIKRKYGSLLGKGTEHSRRMLAFNHFHSMNKTQTLTGLQFLTEFSKFMKVDLKAIPPANFYYWFSRADLQFNLKQSYKIEDLSIVAYIAALWAINKHNQAIKTADVTASKLSTQ